MKIYNYILIILILGVFTNSCTEEDEGPTYPGQIIIHGATYINMPGSLTNSSTMRMYAFSGSHENDMSSMSGEDWTYELWIKVDPNALIGDRNAPSGITAGGACISERRYNFELYLIDDADADYAIKYGKLNSNDDLHAASMQSNESSLNLQFNEWVHVAISRSSDDGIAKFYINGVLIDSSSDPVWIQPVNDKWLDFNYMYRGGSMNFFQGSMENIRVSYIDRYPEPFSIDRLIEYPFDEHTLLQLNLNKRLTAFNPANDYDKIQIEGIYDYYIKVHNTNTWTSEEDQYLPLGDY
jgi:hypothetical protein